MRKLIVIAVVSAALAAAATGAAAQPRMTFRCHDPAATACDGRFVVNGRETFLLGVYDSGFSRLGESVPPIDGWESALFTGRGDVRYYRGLADFPLDVYLNYLQGLASLEEIQRLLDVLAKYGVMWFQTANCSANGSYRRYAAGFTVDRDGGQFARALAAHPQMAGYYVADECGDSSFGTNLVPETQKHHATLKSYDPAAINLAVLVARGYRHPRFWTAPPNGDPLATSAPTADLFGTDPYPIFAAEPATGYHHYQVGDYIARLRDEVPPDRPILSVLQLFKFGPGGRLPTWAEMRMHAYASIVEGAQGIFWWDIGENGLRKASAAAGSRGALTAADAAEISGSMQNLKDLMTELRSLEPALLAAPTPSALLDVSPREATARAWRIAALRELIPRLANFADRQWYQAELDALTATPPDDSLSPMLRQASPQRSFIRTRVSLVGGVGYVIAYNFRNVAVNDVTFTWRSAPTTVEVVGENRTITPTGNTFRDDFGPYAARVYVVR